MTPSALRPVNVDTGHQFDGYGGAFPVVTCVRQVRMDRAGEKVMEFYEWVPCYAGMRYLWTWAQLRPYVGPGWYNAFAHRCGQDFVLLVHNLDDWPDGPAE
jgi:hypothetical protein